MFERELEIATDDEDEDVDVPDVKFEDGFQTINFFLAFIGLCDIFYEKSNRNVRYLLTQKLLFCYNYIQTVILLVGEGIFYYLAISNFNVEAFFAISEMLPCTLITIFGLTYANMMLNNRKKLIKIVKTLKLLWPDQQNKEAKKIIVKNLIPARKFCILYVVLINGLASLWSILPVIGIGYNLIMIYVYGADRKWSHNVTLPYIIWYPYDYKQNWWTYLLTYFSQDSAGIFVVTVAASGDCFFCFVLSHLCMHFQLMQQDIRMLNMPTKDSEEVDMATEASFRKIIKKHVILLALVDDLQEVYSWNLFAKLLCSSFLICLQLFCVIISPSTQAFKYMLFVIVVVTEMALKCTYGNSLKEESEAVVFAAYSSGWVSGPKSLKNGILMLQIRASKPAVITAMGFTTISMDTFSAILSNSWSYFTLLRNMYGED